MKTNTVENTTRKPSIHEITEAMSRLKFIISTKNANRIDRLAAQLNMDRRELVERLLERAVRDTDGNLAMGDDAGEWALAPNLCDDYDCTDSLDGMTVAEVMAADRKGPGTIQRQRYVADCIKRGCAPAGNPAKGEKLPRALAKRIREDDAHYKRIREEVFAKLG